MRAITDSKEGNKKFRILSGDFTEAGGELTPSIKLKRDVISARYASDIAAITKSGKK